MQIGSDQSVSSNYLGNWNRDRGRTFIDQRATFRHSVGLMLCIPQEADLYRRLMDSSSIVAISRKDGVLSAKILVSGMEIYPKPRPRFYVETEILNPGIAVRFEIISF